MAEPAWERDRYREDDDDDGGEDGEIQFDNDRFEDVTSQPASSDDDDEDDFIDALDREVRQLEEAGLDPHFDTRRTFSNVDEARRDVEDAAREYEPKGEDHSEIESGKGEAKRKEEEELAKESPPEEEGAREEEEEDSAETEARKKREDAMTDQEREALRADALALKKEGNDLYSQSLNEEAEAKYSAALEACPLCFESDRAVFAANRAAARMRFPSSSSGLEPALEDCHLALRLKPDYLKAYARRGQIYEELDKPHEALRDFEKVLELDRDHREARRAVQRLPAKVAKKDEEIKQEMFANLKKLGNMVLNPFGLSTENFNFVQDPSTGSYSVNFSQNPQQQQEQQQQQSPPPSSSS